MDIPKKYLPKKKRPHSRSASDLIFELDAALNTFKELLDAKRFQKFRNDMIKRCTSRTEGYLAPEKITMFRKTTELFWKIFTSEKVLIRAIGEVHRNHQSLKKVKQTEEGVAILQAIKDDSNAQWDQCVGEVFNNEAGLANYDWSFYTTKTFFLFKGIISRMSTRTPKTKRKKTKPRAKNQLILDLVIPDPF
jgi:hypothetical protein